MASASSQRTTQSSSHASASGDSNSLMTSTEATSMPRVLQLRQPGPDRAADARVEDALEVLQGGGIGEDDRAQGGGVVGAEAALDLGPGVGVVVADLARHDIGVDRHGARLPQHPRHRALPAADVAGEADDLHDPADATGSGWQRGQKCVLRWPTTIRRMARPHR